ncbi:Protein kinase-like domain protein [Niveomyces insectorum RCEF 264]|uniref:Protein kinase-like domain protein n=1 Tax=Niveomyces insectorum RCEF 264 TaxID=1081102 RepID=A0A162IAT8_9HYPO|nr:Protein kinase-like domain protein [Niveomyces insectorum RCEF 264]
MPYVVYSLDSAIERFFAGAGVASSRAECDDIARRSYTVVAGPHRDRIVQFREQAALLDAKVVALAKDMHVELVPRCSEIGRVGGENGPQLVIYEMEKVPGDNCVTARFNLAPEKRVNIVISLARFFAQAWKKGVAERQPVDIVRLHSECCARLDYLAGTLPMRFLPVVAKVQATLPQWFKDDSYPVVLTHADLNEMNILIDPSSGDITGIVDWSEASMQPFGFALYALDNALGTMSNDGWRWYDHAEAMRESFWDVFQAEIGSLSASQLELVKLAETAGILIRYGTAYDSGFSGLVGVRDTNGDDFGFLDALL